MDVIDDKLRAIVTRVELTKLSDMEKETIYQTVADGLQSTVWPILIKYMPKEQLEDLAKNPAKVTIESYGKLIDDTISDGKALEEISKLMVEILDEVDKALTEEGLAQAPAAV